MTTGSLTISAGAPSAIFLPLAKDDDLVGDRHYRLHDVFDHKDGDALFAKRTMTSTISLTSVE
ncbi:MAG: hypothetical protein ACLUEQ_01295 [Cloacibacillus evryensis]